MKAKLNLFVGLALLVTILFAVQIDSFAKERVSKLVYDKEKDGVYYEQVKAIKFNKISDENTITPGGGKGKFIERVDKFDSRNWKKLIRLQLFWLDVK